MLCLIKPFFSAPFSSRTFIKHLPGTKFERVKVLKICSNFKSITSISSSHFDNLTSSQQDQISLYVDTLLEWNQNMNLTAVREKSEVMERHIDDSLAILPPIMNSYASHCGSSCSKLSVVDVGSGAGLPGLVLAIACPDWKITLLESMNKRCLFLEHVISVTGLKNVQVVRGRAENLGNAPAMRESFDVAVARAVAELRVLAEYCLPLVRVGGLFVAAKGHDPEDEVRNAERAIHMLGGSNMQQLAVESHSPYGQRTAILCLKDRSTPRMYPRDPGTPAKMPL